MVRSGIMQLLKALLGAVYITEKAKNEHEREQLEYNSTHGVLMTGFESALVDGALRGISALSTPLKVSYSPEHEEPGVGGSKLVCLSSKFGLPAGSAGFWTEQGMIEVYLNDSICSAYDCLKSRTSSHV